MRASPRGALREAQGRIRANRYVERFGLRLLPRLYAYANPMPYQAARDMEVELAIALREQGLRGLAGVKIGSDPDSSRFRFAGSDPDFRKPRFSVDEVRDDFRGLGARLAEREPAVPVQRHVLVLQQDLGVAVDGDESAVAAVVLSTSLSWRRTIVQCRRETFSPAITSPQLASRPMTTRSFWRRRTSCRSR